MKRILMVTATFAACTDAAPPDESTTSTPALVTHFVANGNGADGFIADSSGNGGFLQVDENLTMGVRTVMLSFALTFPDPLDATKFTQDTGSGLIPTSNFSSSLLTGQLDTTTTFPIEHCTYSIFTGLIGCVLGSPITFHLTWTKNNVASFSSHGTNTNDFGCASITNQGSFTGVSAFVNGTFAGKTSSNSSGTLHDSHQTSVTKDFSNNCP